MRVTPSGCEKAALKAPPPPTVAIYGRVAPVKMEYVSFALHLEQVSYCCRKIEIR